MVGEVISFNARFAQALFIYITDETEMLEIKQITQ